LQDSDEFSTRRLGLQWSWNHNPVNSAWSLSQRPGWLRLRALPAQQIVNARNTLTQILQGPEATYTARIDISRMVDGQRAGLSLFGVRPAWIGVVQDGGERRVTLSIEGAEQAGPQLAGRTVQLRAQVQADQTVRYSWRSDARGEWQAMGGAIPLAQFSWWKGSRPALFTFTRGAEGGLVDVDWFRASGSGLNRQETGNAD
jgi:beta-xylosidase